METLPAIWRPWPDAPILLMAGRTSGYRTDPNGEIVLGHVARGAMCVRRGRRRFVFGAGDACAWDSSALHEGTAHGCAAWDAGVIVVEPPAITDQLRALELAPRAIDIPHPLVDDRALSARLVALHRSFEQADASRLAHDVALDELLSALFARCGYAPPSATTSRSRALRDRSLYRACDLLLANPARNVTLDELARVAGIPRFRLVRLFRAAFGAPPHRFQLAQRIKLARRLLENGASPSEVAAATGFADQAHMHRHFVRTLGITPKRYAQAFAARTFKTAEQTPRKLPG